MLSSLQAISGTCLLEGSSCVSECYLIVRIVKNLFVSIYNLTPVFCRNC